jgi:hypothetical protein
MLHEDFIIICHEKWCVLIMVRKWNVVNVMKCHVSMYGILAYEFNPKALMMTSIPNGMYDDNTTHHIEWWLLEGLGCLTSNPILSEPSKVHLGRVSEVFLYKACILYGHINELWRPTGHTNFNCIVVNCTYMTRGKVYIYIYIYIYKK